MRVCVLGAGVIGAATAYYLAREGHAVTVVERNAGPGFGASYANGAQLSYSYVAPLASPSVLPRLPAWLVSRTAPLRFAPAFDAAQWRWCLAFLRECTAARSARTTAALLALGAYSRALLQDLRAGERLDFGHRESGKLVIYRNARDFAAARRQMAIQARLGTAQEALNERACLTLEPALAPLAGRIAGGIHTPSEETADCHRFTRELARIAAERFGAVFHYQTNVIALRAEAGRLRAARTEAGEITADAFVLALGTASRALLRPLGITLPILPLKGYSLTMPVEAGHRAPAVSITDLHHKLVYASLGNRLRIAGMVDITGENTARDAARIALLARQAQESLPNAGDYTRAESWAGARPATPDSRPLLGSTPYANLWLNTGHGPLGFTFACASARLLADALAGVAPALSLAPYALGGRRAEGGLH